MKEEKEKKEVTTKEHYDDIVIPDSLPHEEDKFADVSESLRQQILEFESDDSKVKEDETVQEAKKGKKKHTGLKVAIGLITVLTLVTVFFVGTKPGRKFLYNWGANIVSDRMDTVEKDDKEETTELFTKPTEGIHPDDVVQSQYRREDYVANFLICGLEQIFGGSRTDSMMIVSVNIKDNTIKLTSLMRDCYVPIEGHGSDKLNAAYSYGGIDLLMNTIEENFKIDLDGYATVNFDSFETIIDKLGGVEIELGQAEASYLRTTNYISDPKNRTVVAGWNNLNGNQALGYARVRKVATLGGENNDFGRTLRQRRLLNALFEKYKSKSALELINIMYDILPEITTNLTVSQVSDTIEQIVERRITTIENFHIPAEGCFRDVRNEKGAVLELDFDANIQQLYHYIFLDELPTEDPLEVVSPSITPAAE